MPRLDLNLYAGENGQNHRFSAIGATSSQGLVNIIIPILIAALIVLNTMLGSVYERVKEIGIFSSIGLSPANIAMLFIAEAIVYGIIGAVSGYLIGQGLAKLISVLPHPARPVPEFLVHVGGTCHRPGHRGRPAVHDLPGPQSVGSGDAGGGPHLARPRTRRRCLENHPAVRGRRGAGAGHQSVSGRVVPRL